MLLYLQTSHKQFIDRHAYCTNLDKCPSFLPTKPEPTSKCLPFQIPQTLLLIPAMRAESLQSCPTLCNSVSCSPPGPSVHEILQARRLEWVTISFSRGSSQPRDRTWVSLIAGRFFAVWATRESCTYISWTLRHCQLSDVPLLHVTIFKLSVELWLNALSLKFFSTYKNTSFNPN